MLATVAVTRGPSTLTDSDTITNASLVLPRRRVQKAESAQFCRQPTSVWRVIRHAAKNSTLCAALYTSSCRQPATSDPLSRTLNSSALKAEQGPATSAASSTSSGSTAAVLLICILRCAQLGED